MVHVEAVLDRTDEIGHRRKNPATNRLVSGHAEPALDEVEVEVQVDARGRIEPVLRVGVLVDRVVVQGHVHRRRRGNLVVDAPEERQGRLVMVARPALANDRTRENVASDQERGGAVTCVVAGNGARDPFSRVGMVGCHRAHGFRLSRAHAAPQPCHPAVPGTVPPRR